MYINTEPIALLHKQKIVLTTKKYQKCYAMNLIFHSQSIIFSFLISIYDLIILFHDLHRSRTMKLATVSAPTPKTGKDN